MGLHCLSMTHSGFPGKKWLRQDKTTYIYYFQVMSNCHNIPMYTPVAIFTFGHYVTGTVGIFAGCLDNGQHGFKVRISNTSRDSSGDSIFLYLVNDACR